MQPGRDRRFTPEGAGIPKRRDEGFLHGIGGHFRIAGSPKGDGPHPVAVAAEDLTERVRVAGAMCREQLTVGQLEEVVQARHHGTLS